ncbi:MAG: DNA-directed RNA polymerase subunit omega [Pseudomonadota bacterium]
MARVTVEDCLDYVDNRFSLVHLAAQRTKQLYKGSKPIVNCKNRESVISLREIADGKVRQVTEEVNGKRSKKKTAS